MGIFQPLLRWVARNRGWILRPQYILVLFIVLVAYFAAGPTLKFTESYMNYRRLQTQYPDFLAYTQSRAFITDDAPVHGDALASLASHMSDDGPAQSGTATGMTNKASPHAVVATQATESK